MTLSNEQRSTLTRGTVSPAVILIGLVVLGIIGTVFALNVQVTQEQKVAAPEEFKPAPAFTLRDYSGSTVSLSDSHGKVRILNSWATWCPYCVNELPAFVSLQEEFGDEILVVAINRKESPERSRAYLDSLGIASELTFLLDPEDLFYRDAGGFGMPVTLFVDGDGNTVTTKRGALTLEQMREEMLKVLNRESKKI